MFVDPYGNFRNHAKLPAAAMKTYRIASPRDVSIVATCAQVGCKHWRDGWDTLLDESTDIGVTHAQGIRQGVTGRTFRELGRNSAGLTVFRFDAHQRCFTDHKTRPQRFGVVGGDGRGNPLQIPLRLHQRPEDWVEDVGEHQQKIIDAQARG